MYASIVHHRDWLHSIMHASNSLRVISLFCDNPAVEIRGSVKTVMYDDCEGVVDGNGNMSRLTGIPAHIAILNRMDKLEASLSEGFANMSIKMDDMSQGSEAYHANQLLGKINVLFYNVLLILLTRTSHHTGKINELKDDMRAAVGELRASGRGGHTLIDRDALADADAEVAPVRGTRHQLFMWGGQFHALPFNFVTLHMVINFWYVGTSHPHIPPLRYAKASDFPKAKVRSARATMSMMKKLMGGVERAGRSLGYDFDVEGVTTTARSNELFMTVDKCFPKTSKGHKRGVSWKTLYNQWANVCLHEKATYRPYWWVL